MEYSDKLSPFELYELKNKYDSDMEAKQDEVKSESNGKRSLTSLLSNPGALQQHIAQLKQANQMTGN